MSIKERLMLMEESEKRHRPAFPRLALAFLGAEQRL